MLGQGRHVALTGASVEDPGRQKLEVWQNEFSLMGKAGQRVCGMVSTASVGKPCAGLPVEGAGKINYILYL